MRHTLLWWFLLVTSTTAVNVGPFQFSTTCEEVKAATLKQGTLHAFAVGCWDDGRKP